MSYAQQTASLAVPPLNDAMPFTLDDLVKALSPGVMLRAVDVHSINASRNVEVSGDGQRLTAITPSQSKRGLYHQTIIISRVGAGLKIKGYCTCPIGQNCKHIGAALLKRMEAFSPSPGPTYPEVPTVAPVALSAPASASQAALPEPKTPPPPNIGLAVATRSWLDRVEQSLARPVSAPLAATSPTRRLLYVLDRIQDDARAGLWAVQPQSVSFAKDGRIKLNDRRPVDPDHADRLLAQGVKYLTADDIDLLRDLAWHKRNKVFAGDVVLQPGLPSTSLLRRLLSMGQARLHTVDGAALRSGPPVAAEPLWQTLQDGRQQLYFSATDGRSAFDAVIALDPPHYVRGGEVGPILSDLPAALAIEVARAPSIGLAEAGLVKGSLARHQMGAAAAAEVIDATTGEVTASLVPKPILPLPVAAGIVETKRIAPTVKLRLFLGDVRLKERFRWHAPEPLRFKSFSMPLAQLSFDYAGDAVAVGDPRTTIEQRRDDRLVLIPRDRDREDAALQRLRSMRFIPSLQAVFDVQGQPDGVFWLRPRTDAGPYEMLDELDDPERFIHFSATELPRLQTAGWDVQFDATYPYQIAKGEPGWWADVGDGSGIDWVTFELGITFEGHRINIVPQLASLIARLPEALLALAVKPGADKAFAQELARVALYANLPDGRLLPLPGERVAPMLRGLLELIGPRADRLTNGRVKLHRAEAAALAGFADLTKVTWAASAHRLIELGQSLRRGKSLVPVKPPADFKASLRPYQSDGLAWLDFLRDAGFGGVLADDMGLGKTVQGLAFLAREKAEGRLTKPALIVAPTSVLPNWQAEAEKFAPGLSVLPLRGLERKALFDQIPQHDVVLTTYPLLARDHEILLKQDFHVAILDEAQAIKNPKANVTVLAHQINARHRFALTGTPLENNLGEVWSLFEFLSPGLLGDESSFKRTFRTPIEKHGDPVAQGFLSRRLKPFMLRRTKAEVATELPPKTEIIERIQLEGAQRDLYETVRSLMEKRVREEISKKGLAQSHIVFLDALLKLRQICCDPRLLKMEAAKKVKQSAKLDRLMELLPEMVAEGRKILLFSQFTSMLDLIEVELQREKIAFVTLRGDTSDRSAPVKQFQTGDVPVFLLSLKAGGTGLNLTAADTVIHYDPWWNPAVENQATDRAYRIGQDKPVFVHKLIVQDGIEDAIELLKKKKAALADALFEGSSKAPMKLTEDDIAALFAPIGATKTKAKR